MKRIQLFILLFCLCVGTLSAQKRYVQQGDEAVDRAAYAKAIPLYRRAVKKSDDPEAILKLANCYRLVRDYEAAEEWYEKAVQLPEKPVETYFYYGHTLLQQEKVFEARQAFKQFAELAPDDPRGPAFVEGLDRLQSLQSDLGNATVEPFPFNTPQAEFGAFPYDGGIVFSGALGDGGAVVQVFEGLGTPFLDLYFSKPQPEKKDSANWSSPKPLKGDINTRWHESSFTYSDSTQQALFCRNNFDGKKVGRSENNMIYLKLYTAQMDGVSGSSVQEFEWNSDEYSLTHPSISEDGQTLYFVSDMPGGAGGKDIYVCQWMDDHWSVPRNLGDPVNTIGDELFPSIHADGILYFASNGHPGFGNLDIFSCDLTITPLKVINLGMPLNSPYDDFAFHLNTEKNQGFFTSNREEGAGDDDIYVINYTTPEVEILVTDKIAKLPLENVDVVIKDSTGRDLKVLQTDSLGLVKFKLPVGEFLAFLSSGEFDPVFQPINTGAEAGQMFYRYEIEMYNPPPAMVAVVVNEETKEPIQDAKITFRRMTDNDTILRTTDRNGRFAIQFDRNTVYQMTVHKDGYLNYKSTVASSYRTFEGDTVIPMRLEKIKINEPFVLRNINYDYDKYDIRPDAIPELHRLSKLLADNPEIRIELGSHTDSRGSDQYNERLSRQRAESCKKFIVSQGIHPERIDFQGYGESQLLNQCGDGVECSEEEHERNRRTEFKIIGFIEGVEIINN